MYLNIPVVFSREDKIEEAHTELESETRVSNGLSQGPFFWPSAYCSNKLNLGTSVSSNCSSGGVYGDKRNMI